MPGTVMLNLTAGQSIPAGKYNITLTGSDGTGSQTASITTLVFVADFELYGSQNLPVPLGSSRNDTFRVASAWGFHGNVTLATTVSPPGPRAFLNTTQVSVTPLKFPYVLLTVDTAGAQLGDYSVTITATASASMSHQLVYHVSAFPQPTPTPPRPLLDPQLLTTIGILASIVVLALVNAAWGRRRGKVAQADFESQRPEEKTG